MKEETKKIKNNTTTKHYKKNLSMEKNIQIRAEVLRKTTNFCFL